MPRRILLFIFLFAAILLAYFALRFIFGSGIKVPARFYEARSEGAVAAQDIVNESNRVAEDIARINSLDKEGKYVDALALVAEVRQKTQDIRGRGADLAAALQIMTEEAKNINSEAAEKAAIESITNHIALVSRLVTYTKEVDELLAVLENHFRGKKVSSLEVAKLVQNINGDVRAVNSFNSQAGQAMDRFDAIVR